MKMTPEQVFQLKHLSLLTAQNTPGDLLENAQKIYQWLAKEALEDNQKEKAKQVAGNI